MNKSSLQSKGFLVVLSGPSGVGKNTVLSTVLPQVPGLQYSISVTTRPPRPGEVHGQDYFFVSEEEFDRLVQEDRLLEWAEFVGYRYGTPRDYIEQCLQAGMTVIMDIDIQGARQVRQKMPEAILVFLWPPSLDELSRRIRERGKDSEAAISRRLSMARQELQAVCDYDYVIVNDSVEKAAAELRAIVMAERCRVSRWDHGSRLARLREEDSVQ